jgi:hypothetical protein
LEVVGVRRILDIRLKNSSQLSGFAIDVKYQNIFRKKWAILLSCTLSMIFHIIVSSSRITHRSACYYWA